MLFFPHNRMITSKPSLCSGHYSRSLGCWTNNTLAALSLSPNLYSRSKNVCKVYWCRYIHYISRIMHNVWESKYIDYILTIMISLWLLMSLLLYTVYHTNYVRLWSTSILMRTFQELRKHLWASTFCCADVFGLSMFRFVGLLICRSVGWLHLDLSKFWLVTVSVCRCFGLSALVFINVSVSRRFVLSMFWLSTFRIVDVLTSYLLIFSVCFLLTILVLICILNLPLYTYHISYLHYK